MPPARSAKRASAESLSGDRLSALPDGVLHTILSFLPAPEAVRTSALSRRWRHLWRTAPCIKIDMREFGITLVTSGGDLSEKWRKFEDFTTSLLLFRSGTVSLDRFRLDARPHCLRVVDRWVRRGLMYCPQVLEVLMWGTSGGVFRFPHLGASSCRLKRLHLRGVHLDSDFAEQIQSGCLMLEELELKICTLGFQEITSRSLKRLIIDTTLRNLTGGHFVITAPCLLYLRIRDLFGCYPNGIFVHVTDSLVKAIISLSDQGKTFSLGNQRRLLVDLCNVPNLELGGFQTKAMLIGELDKFPIFRNMQTLKLIDCFHDNHDLYDKLEALGTFLQNAPCLKKLTLQGCMFEVDFGMEGQIVRKSISLPHEGRKIFQCPKMKSVEVIYEGDHDNQLLELLWGIGRILPNVTVTVTNIDCAVINFDSP